VAEPDITNYTKWIWKWNLYNDLFCFSDSNWWKLQNWPTWDFQLLPLCGSTASRENNVSYRNCSVTYPGVTIIATVWQH